MQDKREGAPDQEGEAPGGAKARKEASDGRDLYLNIRVPFTSWSITAAVCSE